MKSCKRYRQQLSELADGVLGEEDRAALQAHLADCPACRAYYEDLLAIHGVLGKPDTAPAGFARRVADLAAETPQRTRTPRRRWVVPAAIAACCLLLAIRLFPISGGAGGEQMRMARFDARCSEDTSGAEEGLALDDADSGAAAEEPPAPEPSATCNQPEASPAAGMEKSAVQGVQMDQTDACPPAAVRGTLTAAAEDAGPWAEDAFGGAAGAGAQFLLTEEQYLQLRQLLTEAGADFTEASGDPQAQGYLLRLE